VSSIPSIAEPYKACADTEILDFKPFGPIDKRTECTHHEESSSRPAHSRKHISLDELILDADGLAVEQVVYLLGLQAV
jgi:hypothetical protein